jgi:hypothetical protein
MLCDAIERLSLEFPVVPIGVISRCVEAARVAVPQWPAPLVEVVDAVERLAREDLRRIAEAVRADGTGAW